MEQLALQEPELVAMRPEEHREAVCLLAALIRAARACPLSSYTNRVAGSFGVGSATGEPRSRNGRGVV